MPGDPEMKDRPLRAGVIGVGSLGQHHARVYGELPGVELAGVFDVNRERAEAVAKRCRCRAFRDVHELMDEVHCVSVAVPTHAHLDTTLPLLERGKAVLLEKPMTRTLAEADILLAAAKKHGALLQIGHIERFNEAIQELRRLEDRPRFIEVHRLGPFSQRNTDIGVVADLMIHDLDIILDVAGAQVSRIEAAGVAVLSEHEDIANARLTLADGCVANVTASRVTLETRRKIRIFSEKRYISIDYPKQEMVVYSLKPGADPKEKQLMNLIQRQRITFGRQEPLKAELAAFIEAVRTGTRPVVSGEEGRQALAVALEISRQIRQSGHRAT